MQSIQLEGSRQERAHPTASCCTGLYLLFVTTVPGWNRHRSESHIPTAALQGRSVHCRHHVTRFRRIKARVHLYGYGYG